MSIFYKITLGLFIAAAMLLLIYPQIDIQVEQLFYQPKIGFFLENKWWVQFFYNSVPFLLRCLGFGLILFFILINVLKRKIFGMDNRKLLYLLLVLIVGPGLIVNAIFKDHFGRARPYQITEFGGNKTFSRALVIADQCDKNCSFPSGHAALGFYFIALALLCSRWQKTMFSLTILLGFLIGGARMIQGDHFLSDVVFSGLITFIVSYTLYYYIIVRKIKS